MRDPLPPGAALAISPYPHLLAPPPNRDRRGACRGRPDRAADPAHRALRLLAAVRRAVAPAQSDLAVCAARVERGRHRAPDPRVRALRQARTRDRLRRRRADGQRRLFHRPVPGHAHRQAHRHARGRRGDPGRRLRRHGQHGAAVARRRRVRQQGGGRPARRDQHLHRLQPGLSRSHLQGAARVVPGEPARRARDRTGVAAGRAAQAHRGRRRGPGRPRDGHGTGRARP